MIVKCWILKSRNFGKNSSLFHNDRASFHPLLKGKGKLGLSQFVFIQFLLFCKSEKMASWTKITFWSNPRNNVFCISFVIVLFGWFKEIGKLLNKADSPKCEPSSKLCFIFHFNNNNLLSFCVCLLKVFDVKFQHHHAFYKF